MVYLVYVEILDCSILQRFHIYVCKSTSVHSTWTSLNTNTIQEYNQVTVCEYRGPNIKLNVKFELSLEAFYQLSNDRL